MVLERMIYVLKKNDKAEDSEKIVRLLKSMSPNGKRDVGLKELVERWMKERERKAQNYELWRCGKFGANKDWWTLPKWCNGLVKEVDMASVSEEEKLILKEGNKRAFREVILNRKICELTFPLSVLAASCSFVHSCQLPLP